MDNTHNTIQYCLRADTYSVFCVLKVILFWWRDATGVPKSTKYINYINCVYFVILGSPDRQTSQCLTEACETLSKGICILSQVFCLSSYTVYHTVYIYMPNFVSLDLFFIYLLNGDWIFPLMKTEWTENTTNENIFLLENGI